MPPPTRRATGSVASSRHRSGRTARCWPTARSTPATTGCSDAALRDFHLARTEVLATAGADLLAMETVPSEQEATVLLQVLDEMPEGTLAWLSLTCADGSTTRRGEDVDRVFGLARGHDRVVAVGVNCTAPGHLDELVGRAVAASGKPAVAYPNSGESWDGAGAHLGRRRRRCRRRRRAALGRARCAATSAAAAGSAPVTSPAWPGRSARPDRTQNEQTCRSAFLVRSPTVGVTARSSPSGVETQTRNSYGFLISPIVWPVQRCE